MPDLADLTADDFEPHVGTTFAVDYVLADSGEPGVLQLELTTVTRRPAPPEGRTPFSLLFRGPDDPLLGTDVHRLRHDELGVLDVFFGPVMVPGDGVAYQAVFA